jgi:hypothetical protein
VYIPWCLSQRYVLCSGNVLKSIHIKKIHTHTHTNTCIYRGVYRSAMCCAGVSFLKVLCMLIFYLCIHMYIIYIYIHTYIWHVY